MTLLKVFPSRAEAELCRSILQSENIWSHIIADDQAGLTPSMGFTTGVKLMVQSEDLEKAQKILETMTEDTIVRP